MGKETVFTFENYTETSEGILGRLYTKQENIPVNILIDNAAQVNLKEGNLCSMEVMGLCGDFRIFADEKAYYDEGQEMASVSLIPIGTFPATGGEENLEQSADILFSGKITDVKSGDELEGMDVYGPDWQYMEVETLGMYLHLYVQCRDEIKTGNFVHGSAWLYGNVNPRE